MTDGYQAPWNRPEVQIITGIFGGKIINIRDINIVEVNNEEYEDIQR